MSDDLDRIAFDRWLRTLKGRRPSVGQAYFAGRADGYALGRRVAELEAEMVSYELTAAGKAHLEGKK